MPQIIEVPNYGQVEFPDGMSDADIVSAIKKTSMGYKSAKLSSTSETPYSDLRMGALKGATDIGATLLQPVDYALNKLGITQMTNAQRRADLSQFFTDHADTNSMGFKGGELGAQVAGTAGIGGAVAKPLMSIAPRLAASIASGGLSLGDTGGSALANTALRTAGGAINGGLSAGLVNPDEAKTGAVIGGLIPGVVQLAAKAGNAISGGLDSGAKSMMQSALKPTPKQLKTGDADIAIQTLLDNGINATKGGVSKIRTMIDDLNNQISDKIANSTATVSKQKTLDALANVKTDFASQVSPTADLNAIDNVAADFANHPGIPTDAIPVQQAQQLKQGTYSVIAKKYGQMGSADTEAQKALAWGLKEQIASAVPDVGGLNTQESRLIKTLGVTERRAMMDLNKNPMGLALLAHDPVSWAMFMADKSALFKSLAARMANSASKAAPKGAGIQGLLDSPQSNSLLTKSMVQGGLLAVPAMATSSP